MNRTAFDVAAAIDERSTGRKRFMVAVAGPPASGKSSLAERLTDVLNENEERAAILPMDGFHLDNAILEARRLESRKGAPETFDFDGFERSLSTIRDANSPVFVPVFDRRLDLALADAREIGIRHRIIVVEGNYLLLDREPWRRLSALFDFTVFLDVNNNELERRLLQRWLDHDHSEEAARQRVQQNDMVNVRLVNAARLHADIVVDK